MTYTARETTDPLERLEKLLRKLPGVGERTARRIALHLVHSTDDFAGELGRVLMELHGLLRECGRCGNVSESDLCPVCSDRSRDPRSMCIVSTIQDLMAIERSGAFHGTYHVLHGTIAPLEGKGPDQMDTPKLLERIGAEGVQEVILATNPTVEGEATASWLAGILRERSVKITRIASGIQHGGELEYADPVSVATALDRRGEY